MAKVIFQMIVFNGDYVLEAALEALRPYGQVLAVEGPVRYWQQQGYKSSVDRTRSILGLDPNVIVTRGLWEEKDQMMRAAERWIPEDTTHVWMVDADEVWKPEAIERTLQMLDNTDSVSFKPYTFYGGFERTLGGFELRSEWIRIQRWYPGAHWASHRPPTVLNSDGKPMRNHRHYNSPERFYHYSYVFPKQVKDKVAYYESWNAGVIPQYFEKVYLPWVQGTPGMRAAIESRYEGVHEWLPHRRDDCYTEPFGGTHPYPIQSRMATYLERFVKELAEYMFPSSPSWVLESVNNA